MLKVTVYENRRRIELMVGLPGTDNWNLPMNESYFTVFRDTQNVIEFVIRNNDRKPIDLTNSLITATLIDHHTNKVMAVVPLQHGYRTGLATLDLSAFQTRDWSLGYKTFQIAIDHLGTSPRLLYVNQNEGSRGFFEVVDGLTPDFSNKQESTEFLPVVGTNIETGYQEIIYYRGSALKGNLQDGNPQGIQTMAVMATFFSGQITIQGSQQVEAPVEESEWLDIQPPATFNNFTGSKTFSFVAQLQWVRIKFTPSLQSGTIDRVVFRN